MLLQHPNAAKHVDSITKYCDSVWAVAVQLWVITSNWDRGQYRTAVSACGILASAGHLPTKQVVMRYKESMCAGIPKRHQRCHGMAWHSRVCGSSQLKNVINRERKV